jgi:hypothetical protein
MPRLMVCPFSRVLANRSLTRTPAWVSPGCDPLGLCSKPGRCPVHACLPLRQRSCRGAGLPLQRRPHKLVLRSPAPSRGRVHASSVHVTLDPHRRTPVRHSAPQARTSRSSTRMASRRPLASRSTSTSAGETPAHAGVAIVTAEPACAHGCACGRCRGVLDGVMQRRGTLVGRSSV